MCIYYDTSKLTGFPGLEHVINLMNLSTALHLPSTGISEISISQSTRVCDILKVFMMAYDRNRITKMVY